jgi:hypothetical protein
MVLIYIEEAKALSNTALKRTIRKFIRSFVWAYSDECSNYLAFEKVP